MFARSLRSVLRAAPLRTPAAPVSVALRPAFRYSSSTSTPSSNSSNSSTPTSSSSSSSSSSSATTRAADADADTDSPAIEAPSSSSSPTKQQVGQIEPRLAMTFTCTAGPEKGNPTCNHRSTHEFSKRSYTRGIVIVQCPECKARHLIADHLGWFKESTEDGKLRTVEDLLRAKGEKIKKGRVTMDGDIEYAPEE